jgi:2-polyprenyl-3-methyl-5-hydroxy-6-metoxy-1,4-benzoquinol methylase
MNFNVSVNEKFMTENITEDINAAPAIDRRPFLVRALRKLLRLAIDHVHRNVMWLFYFRPQGSFQPFNDTQHDRYPDIFNFVQSTLGADQPLRILSYGCSTGDEVFSLRQYFPHAAIKGIDINPANIAICRRRLKKTPDADISFAVARSSEGEPPGSYDAIFCMAVLRHGSLALPGVTRCDHLIRFEDFARAAADFERCLKAGGLLIIRHSNFRLCDSAAATAFEAILRLRDEEPKTPLFGPDNRLLADRDYPDTVFRKK